MKVLEAKNIKKTIGKREIIDNIYSSLEGGKIFGFLLPNGVGKTTTIIVLVLVIHPNEGNIFIGRYNLKNFCSHSSIINNPS